MHSLHLSQQVVDGVAAGNPVWLRVLADEVREISVSQERERLRNERRLELANLSRWHWVKRRRLERQISAY